MFPLVDISIFHFNQKLEVVDILVFMGVTPVTGHYHDVLDVVHNYLLFWDVFTTVETICFHDNPILDLKTSAINDIASLLKSRVIEHTGACYPAAFLPPKDVPHIEGRMKFVRVATNYHHDSFKVFWKKELVKAAILEIEHITS